MESNRSSNNIIKKFDQFQMKWSSSDDQVNGSGQAKSYTCTFCKRGFSNAQALGGHMNIHRRDRARIRQQLSQEDQDHQLAAVSSEDKSSSHVVEQDESETSSNMIRKPMPSYSFVDGENKSNNVAECANGSGGLKRTEELDLELRLGPEPPPEASTTLSTREFF